MHKKNTLRQLRYFAGFPLPEVPYTDKMAGQYSDFQLYVVERQMPHMSQSDFLSIPGCGVRYRPFFPVFILPFRTDIYVCDFIAAWPGFDNHNVY